jgi:hypothetical protein
MWYAVPNMKARLHYIERSGMVFFYGVIRGLVCCAKEGKKREIGCPIGFSNIFGSGVGANRLQKEPLVL